MHASGAAAQPWGTRVPGGRGWILKWSLAAAAAVVLLPLALLAVVAVVVFVTLGLAAALVSMVRAPFERRTPADDGLRQNVRVIHRESDN